MDTTTMQALIALNTAFYREQAESFSSTRETPWLGWRRLIPFLRAGMLKAEVAAHEPTMSVLDVACGNLRFERFLTQELPAVRFRFHAVDNCGELASGAHGLPGLAFHELDVLQRLLAQNDEAAAQATQLDALPSCDFVGCFGFMHHVPSFELRARLLRLLVECARPGGFIAVSFWQFMHDARLARKAVDAERAARTRPELLALNLQELERDDHLLGWQNTDALRYCHHFEDEEVNRLIAALPAGTAHEVCRYTADGRSGDLNRYVILQRLDTSRCKEA